MTVARKTRAEFDALLLEELSRIENTLKIFFRTLQGGKAMAKECGDRLSHVRAELQLRMLEGESK